MDQPAIPQATALKDILPKDQPATPQATTSRAIPPIAQPAMPQSSTLNDIRSIRQPAASSPSYPAVEFNPALLGEFNHYTLASHIRLI